MKRKTDWDLFWAIVAVLSAIEGHFMLTLIATLILLWREKRRKAKNKKEEDKEEQGRSLIIKIIVERKEKSHG